MKLLIKPIDIVYKQKKIIPIDVVLDFIIETYPVNDYPKVLEIAAGGGRLSNCLAELGYKVTAMDPKLEYRDGANYEELIEFFNECTDISNYDLGIAIHPCGIHKDIINNFKINDKALFLIPCCTFSCVNPELTSYRKNQNWLKHLEKLNPRMKKKVFFYDSFNPFSNAFYTKNTNI